MSIQDSLLEREGKKVWVQRSGEYVSGKLSNEAPDDSDGNLRVRVGRYFVVVDQITDVSDTDPAAVETPADPEATPQLDADQDGEVAPPDETPAVFTYDDGIVSGVLRIGACEICSTVGMYVDTADVKLPPIIVKAATKKKPAKTKAMKPGPLLIFYRKFAETQSHIKNIGVTCGCLARGHRQLARIDQRVKDRL